MGFKIYTEQDAAIILIVAGIVGIGFAIGLGFAGRAVVRGKGYPDAMNHGFAWGFWLGLIGLIVCACKQPYNQMNQFYNGQPFNGQPYNGQPPYGQPFNGQPGQPYNNQQQYGQPYNAQPYGQPMNGQAAAGGEWTCSCGTSNAADARFCSICGSPRQ
ncbi:MAG: hypothetical protein IKO27_00430 [Ruminococcus sp.]|nr:hypothetical protein [Ruminococcus sp.]